MMYTLVACIRNITHARTYVLMYFFRKNGGFAGDISTGRWFKSYQRRYR